MATRNIFMVKNKSRCMKILKSTNGDYLYEINAVPYVGVLSLLPGPLVLPFSYS